MKKIKLRVNFFQALNWTIIFLLISSNSAKTQVIPDQTLPENSVISPQGNSLKIEGGTTKGTNLFHSFEEFSLPNNREAFFNNALSIENIFSRVTGNSVSSIDSIIRANGTANLFFINPNGIIFGPNARLDIGGSFLGSTANSILFADGFEFSAVNPSASSLLTVNVPIGLRITNPNPITVQGTGHNLIDSPFSFFRGRDSSTSFRVQPSKTLALVGGDLTLSGGVLTAEGGRIELGSIDYGVVRFNSTAPGWTFNYNEVSSFRDVSLVSRSLVDASGFGNGSIQIQGANINLNDASIVLIQNQGLQPDESLRVRAAESIKIRGTTPDGLTHSSLYSETLGSARGANVFVSAPQLIIENGDIGTTT